MPSVLDDPGLPGPGELADAGNFPVEALPQQPDVVPAPAPAPAPVDPGPPQFRINGYLRQPEQNVFAQFDGDEAAREAAALKTYKTLAPAVDASMQSVSQWGQLQDQLAKDGAETASAAAAVARAGAIPTDEPNVFAQFDPKPVAAEKAMPGWGGAFDNFINSAQRAAGNAAGAGEITAADMLSGAAHMSGLLLTSFAKPDGDPYDTSNPYLQAAQNLAQQWRQTGVATREGANEDYATDPNRPVSGVLGALVPNIGAIALAGLTTGGPGAAVVGSGMFGSQNYADALDRGADTQGATLAGETGLLLGGGLPFSNVMRTAAPLASATWGQFGRNMAFGALNNASKAYWEGAGINLATGAVDNAVAAPGQQQTGGQVLWDSLENALPFALVGAGSHVAGQAGAEAAVSDAAQQAGQDKASFITNTAKFFSTLQGNDTLTPQEKVQASALYMAQFSPQVQGVIAAHVSNVQAALNAINRAAGEARQLAPLAPQTAQTKFQGDQARAVAAMQDNAAAIEAKASDQEAALEAELKAGNTPPVTDVAEGAPTPQTARTGSDSTPPVVSERAAPLPSPAENPFEKFDAQTPKETPVITTGKPAEQPVAEPVAVEQGPVAEPQRPAPSEEAAGVAGGDKTPRVEQPAAEPAKEEVAPVVAPTQPEPEQAPLETMSRKELQTTGSEEGMAPTVLAGMTTRDLPDAVRAHRVAQGEPPEPVEKDGVLQDPRIAQLPAPHQQAVQNLLNAAKAWGLRGLRKFSLDSRSGNSVYTMPRGSIFDTVFINPASLAYDMGILRKAGASDDQIHAIYQKVFSEEFGHLQGAKVIEGDWKKEGSKEPFADYYDRRMRKIYDGMTPEARREVAAKYGMADVEPNKQSGNYQGDAAIIPSQVGEEYVRQLWQQSGSGADTEALIRPSAAKQAGVSKQTRILLKSLKDNTGAKRLIGDTLARLRALAAKLAGRGTPDRGIEGLVQAMHDLTAKAETPGARGKKPPVESRVFQRVNPMKVAASARPEPDFDYFGELDEESAHPRGGPDGSGKSQDGTPAGSAAEPRSPAGVDHPGGEQPGALRPVPDERAGAGGTPGIARPAGEPGAPAGPQLTPYAESLLQRREASPPAVNLRPNAARPTEVRGYDYGDAREAKLQQRIEAVRDVQVPVEDQARFQSLVQTLGRVQFVGNAKARDVAEANALVRVMVAAKEWTQKHGSLEAEDGKGNGFGARSVISNALLDEGRVAARSKRLFDGGVPEAEPEEKLPEEHEEAETPASPQRAIDTSEHDHEAAQASFEGTGEPGAEGVSKETPAVKAQNAEVERRISEVQGMLTPYARRLIELWSDSPERSDSKYPAWASQAAKESGRTKDEVLADFHEIVNGLRRETAARGLTRDDFTRVTAAPKPEEGDLDRQESTHGYSLANEPTAEKAGPEHPGLSGGHREGDQVLAGGGSQAHVRAAASASPEEQPQHPSGFLEGYLNHVAENGHDLDDPDSLFRYARSSGQVIPRSEIDALRRYEITGGVEHRAFHTPGPDDAHDYAVKVTRPPTERWSRNGYGLSPDAIAYLTRLDKMNRLAPELDYRVQGVTPTLAPDRAWPSLVTRMNWIHGEEPTHQELNDYMTQRGFVDQGLNVWKHPAGLELGDVHTGNFIKTADGRMVPIDVTIDGHVPAPLHDMRPPATGAASPEPEIRPEAFANRLSEDERLSLAIRDAVHGKKYTSIPNDFTAAEALNALHTDGIDKTFDRVMTDDPRESGLNDRQRVALGQQAIMRLQRMGSAGLSRAIDLIDKLSSEGTRLGQAVQSFALWSRLTPAGVLTKYARIIKPAVDEARTPFEKVIGDIKDGLQETRDTAIDDTIKRPKIDSIIGEAEKASDVQATRQNAKPIWQRYMEATAQSLSRLPFKRGAADRAPLEEFARRLTQNLRTMLDEKMNNGTASKPAVRMGAESKLGEIYRNEPEYRQAWDFARDAIREKYKDDPDKLAVFDDALDRAFEAPVALHDRALTDALKANGLSLRDVVRQWGGKSRATRDQLIADIKARLSLTDAQAEKLGNVLADRFDLMLADARKRALTGILRKSDKPRLANNASSVAAKIMEASNLGALDDEAAYNAIADTYKLPKYDPAVAADLSKRAAEIQQMIADGKEGFQTDRKTADMLNVLQNLKESQAKWYTKLGDGLMALYYGNILGPTTVIRKTISETANAAAELGTMSAAESRRDPLALPRAVAAFTRGLSDRGAADAGQILLHGEGLRRGTDNYVTAGRAFERGQPFSDLPILKYLNKPTSAVYRYVGRALEGGAAFFYAGANEAKANMLAYRIAREEQAAGNTPAEWDVNRRVAEILGGTAELRAKFGAQAEAEGLTGREAKLRVAELMEQSRPEDLQKAAQDFGTRATFQQDPEGLLGVLARAALGITNKYALFKPLLPFVRVPANVLNTTIDYTPWGFARAYRWDSIRQDQDRYYQQLAKATAGSVMTTALGALFAQYVNDPNPQLMVTAAGPADYQKKKQLMDQGWAPYTVKIGDRYFGYREMPIGFGLALIGHMLDAERYGNLTGGDASQRMAFGMLSAANEFTSRSWMANTADFLDIVRNNNPDRASQAFENFVGRTAGAFVPGNQAALRLIDKAFDPTLYTSKTLGGMLMSQVAFARRLNDPAINALGQPVQTNPLSAFYSEANPDAVWQGLSNKGVFVPSLPSNDWLGDRAMTGDERYRYATESGQNLRAALENGGLDKMAEMDREQAQTYLNQLAKAARDPVKAELRAEGIDNGTILSVGPKPKAAR